MVIKLVWILLTYSLCEIQFKIWYFAPWYINIFCTTPRSESQCWSVICDLYPVCFEPVLYPPHRLFGFILVPSNVNNTYGSNRHWNRSPKVKWNSNHRLYGKSEILECILVAKNHSPKTYRTKTYIEQDSTQTKIYQTEKRKQGPHTRESRKRLIHNLQHKQKHKAVRNDRIGTASA